MAGLLGLRGHRVQQTAVSNQKGRSGRDVWVHGLWVCIGLPMVEGVLKAQRSSQAGLLQPRGVVCGVQQSAVKTEKDNVERDRW
jgi:hypothetical protein